jgi:hypothetical protein
MSLCDAATLSISSVDMRQKAVLKAMTDYVKGQDNISVVADTDIEVVTWPKP